VFPAFDTIERLAAALVPTRIVGTPRSPAAGCARGTKRHLGRAALAKEAQLLCKSVESDRATSSGDRFAQSEGECNHGNADKRLQ